MFIFIPEYITSILGDTLLILLLIIIPLTGIAMFRFLTGGLKLFADDRNDISIKTQRQVEEMKKQQELMSKKVDILFKRFLENDTKRNKH